MTTEHQDTNAGNASAGNSHTGKPQTLARPLSRAQGIRLIAMREILTTIRSKAFVWSSVIVLAAVAILILAQNTVGNLMESIVIGDDETTVSSTMELDELEGAGGFVVHLTASPDEALDDLRSGDADLAVITGAESSLIELYSEDGTHLPGLTYADRDLVIVSSETSPDSIVQLLTEVPATGYIDGGPDTQFWMVFLMSTAFALLYFMAIMMFSQRIAQTVIEEKSSRIVELLLSTVKPSTILAGKIIGGTVMAFVEVILIVAVALISFAVTGQNNILVGLGPAAIWFAVLFLFGFIVFASLYAALAATVSRPEDVASATSPLTMLVMIPYFLVILANQNEMIMGWLSYIPFSAPVAMPVRLFIGTAEWWEPFVALAVLIFTVVISLWFAARIYENSILRTGKKVKLKEAIRSR